MGESTARAPLGAGRVTAIVILALIAVAAFLLLVDVRINHDDPVVPITDAASRQSMTVFWLGVELLCFVAMILLVFVRAPSPEVAWQRELAGASPDDDIQIGCPGCGTVFEKPLTTVDEPHEQSFRCPNCGRAGNLRMELHKKVQLRQVACGACGNPFTAYRDGAECPACHTRAAA